MAKFTQEFRRMQLFTPLPQDELLIRQVQIVEQLGRPSQMNFLLYSPNAEIKMDDIVGHAITLQVVLPSRAMRHFSGVVTRFVAGDLTDDFAVYHATASSWFELLGHTAECRVFQNKSIPDIIEEVFKSYDFADFKKDLHGSYQPWIYCVQYRESDLNFVTRLMEQEGIYFYWKYEDNKHTMVLCDSPSNHEPFEGYAQMAFRPASTEEQFGHAIGYEGSAKPGDNKQPKPEFGEYIRDWSTDRRFIPSLYSLKDYDFTLPKKPLLHTSDAGVPSPVSNLEAFDFPGEYHEPGEDEGDHYAQLRMQEFKCRRETHSATGDVWGIAAGSTFEMLDALRQSENKKYLITGATYRISQQPFQGGASTSDEGEYDVHFTAIDAATQFRLPRVTPKPVIQGSQTAFVVGPSGQEIHVDQYGRVKVQFMWDRYGERDEKAGTWIRVSQTWAGRKWGTMFIPRIGMEVIVTFLEGDPDQPLITGCVYNGDNQPPYKLPDHATMSTMKSDSSKGGAGFNELRIEDKKGEEQIFVHAEKNLDVRVKNDTFETVCRNRHLVVHSSQYESVGVDRHETIYRDHVELIKRDRLTAIKGKQATKVDGSLSLTVGGDVIETFKMNHSEVTTLNLYQKAMQMVIEAPMGITIKSGGNSVVIDPVGVTIKGNLVVIDSVMALINSGPGSPAMSGQAGDAVAPTDPTAPHEADKADPGEAMQLKADPQKRKNSKYDPTPIKPFVDGGGAAGSSSSASGASPDPEKKKDWIEIELVDEDGNPVPGAKYKIELPDGRTDEGVLDEKGKRRVEGIDPGSCKVTFPELDKEAWKKA